MVGRTSGEIRAFALYGDATGEIDAMGLPVRRDWALGYSGAARIVYGHTPVPRAEWVNGTIDIDQGCVFGGSLTALRWPEQEIVQVEALSIHWPGMTM
jgi:protein phosphatase